MAATHLATFKVEVTVPLGHGLCGGWIKPALRIDSPLWCIGLILLGEEAPIVLAAVDWTGICNDAHVTFTQAIAHAAHTTPERVALHSVHQHNAPFVDVTAQQLISEHKDLPACCDLDWFSKTQSRVTQAIGEALKRTEKVTHFSAGHARVEKVASNRRIIGPDGKIAAWRASACKDPKLREAPEGLIDPILKTLNFWRGDNKLASLHWYATHPMSYYGDGAVNHDFVGIARERRAEEDRTPHVYFTGCAGNIAAGKYNDGAPERREELAGRVYQAMVSCETDQTKHSIKNLTWRSFPVHLPPRTGVSEAELQKRLADALQTNAIRNRAAMQLSYLKQCQNKVPITLQTLHLNESHALLHLPAECFVEYQLFAQKEASVKFIACAAYGNGGPWYIPTAEAYPQSGYEPSASFVDPDAEQILQRGIKELLAG
jgi:hypothetical protein